MEKQVGIDSGKGVWMMGLYVETVMMTPELADYILDKNNTDNRDINEEHVAYLAYQMNKGLWVEDSGIPILFDKSKNMRDGQHRLAAIRKAKKTYNVVCISNVSEEAFAIYDLQRTRTASDLFRTRGYIYSTQLAAITRRYMLLVRDCTDLNRSSKRIGITPMSQLKEYEENKELYDDVMQRGLKLYNHLKMFQKSNMKKVHIVLTATDFCGYILYLTREKGREPKQVYSFINQLAMIDKCEYNAIDRARKEIEKLKAENRGAIKDHIKNGYIKIAWNAFVLGLKDDVSFKIEDGLDFL